MKEQITLKSIAKIYEKILENKISREEASLIASNLMAKEDQNNLVYEPTYDEKKIWDEITFLSGIDLPEEIKKDEEPGYLFSLRDIQQRLRNISRKTFSLFWK